jgi:hypothetical protein
MVRPTWRRLEAEILDQATETDLIPTQHADEFYPEAPSVCPTDSGQSYRQGRLLVRHQDAEFQVGPRVDRPLALDRTTRHREIDHRTFADELLAGKNDRKFGGDTGAVPNLCHRELASCKSTGDA